MVKSKSKASSNDPDTSDAEFLSMLQKWRVASNPSNYHIFLNRLTGNWDILLRFYGGGQSWESRCTSHAELLHGGRFLLEHISGEIFAPDEAGKMRPEPYSASRILGYDNYKKAFTGAFFENQNTYLLTFLGHPGLSDNSQKIEMFGAADEPMLEIHDAMMKYVLYFPDETHHVWTVYALAIDENTKVFDFEYSRIEE